MSLCEIRVVTYKRPQLLKRALSSAIAQTYQNWKAIVFDDSPEQEGRQVIEALNDDRIIYQPHRENLGRAKNIDHAFQSKAYIGGKYAFALEDDNYLFPDFIDSNIAALEENNVNIVLRNQEFRPDRDGQSIFVGETTREKWFQQGVYSPIELHSRLFFCEGITNGGLFWCSDRIESNLQVGPQVKDAMHQELFRTLQIKESIVFEAKPLCVYTFFPMRTGKNFLDSLNLRLKQIRYNRGLQSILIHLVAQYGDSVVKIAGKIAKETDSELLFEERLLKVFYFSHDFSRINKLKAFNIIARHRGRYWLLKDPFRNFLTHT